MSLLPVACLVLNLPQSVVLATTRHGKRHSPGVREVVCAITFSAAPVELVRSLGEQCS
jgi:hypothetical protein